MPVSVLLKGEYGINGIALSVPCRIVKTGAYAIPYGKLTEEETKALSDSAEVLREAMKDVL